MQQTNLAIITRQDKILLCMKKRGFGKGLWNGAGGKVEKGESLEMAMIRELEEETGLIANIENLKNRGVLHFYFDEKSDWNQDVHIFEIKDFIGEPQETDEMKPKWFLIKEIPYDEMWEDDKIWLPRFLKGESIEYDFYFGSDGKIRNWKKIK